MANEIVACTLGGASFFCEAIESRVGRRLAVHELPEQDLVGTRDMGRKARRFVMTGFVLGRNYFADRDRLRDVIEAGGVIELVHPFWGPMRVKVDGETSISESTSKGVGKATFRIPLVESGEIQTLRTATRVDGRSQVRVAVARARAVSRGRRPIDGLRAMRNTLTSVTSLLGRISGRISAVTGFVNDITATLKSIQAAISDIQSQPERLLNSLDALFSAIMLPFRKMADQIVGSPTATAFEAKYELINVISEVLEFDSEGAFEVDVSNLANIGEQLTDKSVASAIQSTQDVQTIRDAITTKRDELTENPDIPDELFIEYRILVSTLMEYLDELENKLPSATEFTVQVQQPAIVVVHDVYGNIDRLEEFINLNSIEHPLFVSAGIPLRALL